MCSSDLYTLLAGFTKPANTIALRLSKMETDTPVPHGGATSPAE